MVPCVRPGVVFALVDEQPTYLTTHLSHDFLDARCQVVDQELEHNHAVLWRGDTSDGRKWPLIVIVHRPIAECDVLDLCGDRTLDDG